MDQEPLEATQPGAGSIKWFMPPTPIEGSRRQTPTQDPSSVEMTTGELDTKNSPGNMVTTLWSGKRWSLRPRFSDPFESQSLQSTTGRLLNTQILCSGSHWTSLHGFR